MALIDTARDLVIIRVVYDGPPQAGKTSSLHALHTVLKTSRSVFSPAEEDGRTQYFDWLEYTGGLFEGRRILAQIVSIPGQPSLQGRRSYLLRTADAIVFVADSRAAGIALSAEYFRDLQNLLDTTGNKPPVLVQANHQDSAGALSAEALQLFFPPDARIMPSVAPAHNGVREAFVTAISLAMGCVKKQLNSGANLYGTPAINDGDTLLTALHNEAGEASAEALVLAAILAAEIDPPEAATTPVSASNADESVRLPLADCDNRHVFPTQIGKQVLQAINRQDVQVQRQMDGAWIGRNDEWRCYSRADWCYANEDDAMQALRQHIRTQIRFSPVLAATRVVALRQNDQGQWRVWQITEVRETLSQRLNSALQQTTVAGFAQSMVQCTASLHQAFETFARYAPQLPITLESISVDERPVYIGILDSGTTKAPLNKQYKDVLAHVRDIVADPLGFALVDNQLDPAQLWAALEAMRPQAPQAVAVLQDILAPH